MKVHYKRQLDLSISLEYTTSRSESITGPVMKAYDHLHHVNDKTQVGNIFEFEGRQLEFNSLHGW